MVRQFLHVRLLFSMFTVLSYRLLSGLVKNCFASLQCEKISIFHGCMVWIEKSVTRVTGKASALPNLQNCTCARKTLQTQRGRTHGAGCVRQWFRTAEPLGERRYENWNTHTHTHRHTHPNLSTPKET